MFSSNNAHDEYFTASRLCKQLDSFLPTNQTQYPTMQSLYSVGINLSPHKHYKENVGWMWCKHQRISLRRCEISWNHDDAAYTNQLDGKSSIIICSENYKYRDDKAPSQKLWPAEILWQSWMMAVEAQRSISGREKIDMSMIWHAARLSTCNPMASIRNGIRDSMHTWEYGRCQYHEDATGPQSTDGISYGRASDVVGRQEIEAGRAGAPVVRVPLEVPKCPFSDRLVYPLICSSGHFSGTELDF